VLTKIDGILAWEQRKEVEKDTRFVELGRYLCEVRAGQYWRLENLKSFDEFLERRFPESRRKAYYLMSIHDHLPPQVRRELKQVGWAKGLELAKLARSRDGQEFDCATWLHKAHVLPKEQFRREVEKELTGKETEPWEIIYFKLYKSQIPVIEQALETAALMLGSDRSRGHCLEMICADFWRERTCRTVIRCAFASAFKLVQVFTGKSAANVSADRKRADPVKQNMPKQAPIRLEQQDYQELRDQVLRRDGWRCQLCDSMSNLEVHHKQFRSHSGLDHESNLITLCWGCHSAMHRINGIIRLA
jgi:HNH endonuclease